MKSWEDLLRVKAGLLVGAAPHRCMARGAPAGAWGKAALASPLDLENMAKDFSLLKHFDFYFQ